MLTFLGLVYGFANMAFFLINAIMGPFSGAALDKIGAKLPILTGTGLMTVGILLFTVLGMRLNTGLIIGFYVIFGGLLILAVICRVHQVTGFKVYERKEK